MVKMLLDRGADVNAGCSALRIASRFGHGNIVEMLLAKGAVMPEEESESSESDHEEESRVEEIEDSEVLPAQEEPSPTPA